MPTYNSVAYLNESIKSLISQTLKNIEIIIIDDFSDDSTYDLLKFYRNHDKRVRFYMMEERRGAAFCRNFGNRLAKADIVMVCDSGDLNSADRAEETYKYFKKNKGINVFHSACVECDEFYSPLSVCFPSEFDGTDKPRIFHPTVAYRREVFENFKYREGNLNTDQYEAFMFEVVLSGHKFGFDTAYYVKKIISSNVNLEERYKQRIKNYKEFGIEVPDFLKELDDGKV